MRGNRYIGLIIVFGSILFGTDALGQKSRATLEKEKQDNQNRIAETEKILKSTEKKKAASLGQLNALNAQIRSRQSLINSINEEIKYVDNEIGATEDIIKSLEDDIEKLKAEYAEMLYAGYKASRSQDKLTFLFSAVSFNQFLMRLKSFEQYGEYRRNQAVQISKVQEILAMEVSDYEQIRSEKTALLGQEIAERDKLSNLQSKQTNLVAELSKKEKSLTRELENRKLAVAKINTLIADLLEAERRKASVSTAETVKLTGNFSGNQRKLPWPVQEGFISMGFGRQKHPVLKLVEVDNKGVYIQTQPKQEIKAVFDGKVTAVAAIPGMNKAVIVQHGEYRTVYANLKTVSVKRNQEVKLNDKIGEIYTDGDGLAELYFELWRNNKTLNPQQWLTKK